MTVVVAGNKKDYPEGLTVQRLIEQEKVETPLYVTVSINDAFIAGDQFETTELHEGDSVEFLYFMGGGR